MPIWELDVPTFVLPPVGGQHVYPRIGYTSLAVWLLRGHVLKWREEFSRLDQ